MTTDATPERDASPTQAAGAAQPSNALSVFSMLAGIAGIILGVSLIISVAAVVMGHIASKKQPYARGFWLTGLIAGYVGIGLFVLFIAAVVVYAIDRAN